MNEFNSLQELYNRLTPAFNSKLSEMKKYKYIKQIDIWNYLSESKWNNKKDLSLYEMVDDILNLNVDNLDEYVLNNINKERQEQNFQDNMESIL